MEDMITSLMGGYHTLSPSKARKLHHLSHTPPEYWTARERMLSGKARTRWLHEERKRAARGGSPTIFDRIWPVGPYWPNGGIMPGGERRRREFKEEVGRMRYREQERAEAHARHYSVHPLDIHSLPYRTLSFLLADGDWTNDGTPNQILNDRCRARSISSAHPFRQIGRANLYFSPRELLKNGRFGEMVGAETEEDRYRAGGWERLEGPFYGPVGEGNWDEDARPRVVEAGNGRGKEGGSGPPFWE